MSTARPQEISDRVAAQDDVGVADGDIRRPARRHRRHVIWFAGKLIGFLQPILIPVAIAIILAYLLDPVVTHLSERRMSRGKAIFLIFTVAFLALAALLSWIVPMISRRAPRSPASCPTTRFARATRWWT